MDPVKSAAALDEKKRRLLALLMKEKGIDPLQAPILRLPRDGRAFPASFAQERLWIINRLDPGNTAYNLQAALRVAGPLRLEVMAGAFAEVTRRHETLRTTFAVGEGGWPVQVIHPPAPFPLPCVDLSSLPDALRPAEARRLAVAEGGRPFDLARGPVLRALVLRLEAAEHVLLFTIHHIASDGWSNGVLIGEIATLYDAFAHGRPSPLPELPVQYADYAAWQRQVLEGEVLERELAWWRERLADSDVLELPTDRPRPAVLGPGGSMEGLEVPAEVAAGLKELGRAGGATLFMVTLAAFQALLARWSGQTDFNVGTPVAGRDRTEVEGLIGFFVNTLVIRAELSGDPSFRELLGRTRTVALESLAHPSVPFEKLVEELSPERSLSHTPLFQVLFALQNAPGSTRTISGLTFLPFEATPETAAFDLILSLMDVGGPLAGTVDYKTALFDRATILRLVSNLRELLAGAAARPDTRLSELPLLTAAERAQLFAEWGRGPDVPRTTQLLHAAFQARAAERPETVAVRQGDETLSHGELARRADRLARHLAGLGVGPEVRVGVCVERSPETIVAVLAVLTAGGAYVPLDPNHPRERLLAIAEDAGLGIVLVSEQTAGLVAEPGRLLVRTREEGTGPLGPSPDPGNAAYVIYTSGTTGRPKGVVIPHAAAADLVEDMVDLFGLGADDRVLHAASLGFDLSVMEIFPILAAGGCLRLARGEQAPAGPELAAELREVTVAGIPPPLLATIPDPPESFPGLRSLGVGGEKCPADLARRWSAGRRFVNSYGPTEATVYVTFWEGTAVEQAPPLGRPVANVRAYVVDRWGAPAPIGVPGELLVGGLGLARGYLGLPARTAESFVPDPFGDLPGERLYRTGDLVRWRADGDLDILGRVDRQVKVRGVRIEPGEVEAVLAGYPAVRECAVVAVADGQGKRLAAFAVPRDGGSLASEELRAWMRERLPEPMIPSSFVSLGALPLTPNGKVDRRALARMAPERVRRGEAEVPRTDAETHLAGIWAEVLGVERVGREDNFFDLGGHSLLATQVVSRVREAFGAEIPLRALFEAPTVAELAARLGGAAEEEGRVLPPVEPAPGPGPFPLSFAQERLWVLDQIEPGGTAYNMPSALRLVGALRPEVLAAVFSEIARRHAVLRTTFSVTETGGGPVQIIAPPAPVPLPLVDLLALSPLQREAELRRLAGDEGGRPFDLTRGPVWRATLMRLGADEHALLTTLHHIASDAWSMGILVQEVVGLYDAFSRGLPSTLPELWVQYIDYAVWQRRLLAEGEMEAALEHWRGQLAGAPVLELPTDRPRAAAPAAEAGVEDLTLSAGLASALSALARRREATLFMVVTAAFQALLSRYSGQTDLTVGTPVAGRVRRELEDLIGFFVNTLVLRGDLGGDPAFATLLDRTRSTALAAFAHQEVPFERLVEEVNPERSLSHSPLFQVVIALQNTPAVDLEAPGLSFRPLEAGGIGAKFDLTLNLAETGDGLAATLEYRTFLFDAATARRMLDGFAILLEGVATDPDLRLSELPLLSPVERVELAAWSGPGMGFPPFCLHERFSAQAGRTPEAVAVVCEGAELSYGELGARSNRLARRLRRLGVGPESRVGLVAERSLETVVGILGILKAGGAYVPLDPSYPKERLQFLLEDSRAPLVLTREHLTDPSLEEESGEDLSGLADPDNAAYVIYTSGSTGVPKGTVVTHRNVARLLAATDGWFGFGPDDVWTLFHSFAFDFSVWEIWGSLTHGGRLVVVPYWVSRTPETFLELLERERVTVLNQTPSAFRQLVQADGERNLALRWVIFGGEALDLPSLAPWFGRHGDERPRLANMYGITETTVHVSFRPVTRADLAEPWRSPVGVPIPDLSIHLLDREGRPVPVGVPGEIHVGGAGLARGYLGRPDLTAERYVPNPFAGPGERLYRSGDLARWRPAGEIDYLGRIDHQVKIRGFRIELGEIEAALARHPAVREAVVLLREEDGDRRLVAYLGTGEGEAPSPGELRTFLAGTLPDYMIPAAFAALPALPLTAHGKVDRRVLAEIRPEGGAGRDHVAPRTATEEVLAGLWGSVLGVERVGVLDDFFALGGHSLLATRLVSRIREAFGVELPLRTLFEAPTVAGLAPRIEAGGEGRVLPPVVRAPRDGRLPLSFPQERLWLLDQIEPGGTAYNVPAGLRLRGALRPDVLARTFGEIARRHEVLRTTFAVPDTGGEPVQVVGPPSLVPLPLVDLASLPAVNREAELRHLAWGEGGRPFDLVRGPLWRALLARLDPDEHALFVTMHHIVSDGWSLGVLVREIAEIYGALSQALAPPLPELPVQYGDYAVWQRRLFAQGAMDSSLAWWRRQLAGAPVLELPTDRPRAAVPDADAGGEDLLLAAGLTVSLNALARRHGATLFMVVTAAFQTLLSRYSGQTDLTVGTPVAGRLRRELEELIGFFVNTLVLRGDLGSDPAFATLLDRTRSTALAAFAHQAVPFERLVEEVNPERSLSHSPLFQVMVALQNTPAADLDIPGLAFRPLDLGGVDAKFDLTLTLAETGEGLAGTLEHRTALFDAATIRRMAGHFAALLAAAAADPERRLSELPLMSEAERHQTLVEWSRTEAVFPGEVPLPEMLARQTAATPDALALISAEERLTYRELDRRSNRLARRLRALGVGPEVPVGLFLDRSVARIVATVAVTRAGGAYVPLDPSHPRERLAFLLTDTGAPVVLTESRWLDALPESPARVLCLDGDSTESDEPLESGAPVDGLLYVMYTSGSTGRPKGVAVAHEGVARLARWAREDAGIGPKDTVLQLTAFTFDVSTMEIWGALLNGATLAIPPAGTLSLEEIGREISRHGVTVLWLSAGLFQQMVDGPLGSLAPLRMLIAGGDALSVPHVRRTLRDLPGVTLVNGYGPTEVTVFTCCATLHGPESLAATAPIGRPIAGTRVVLLDRAGQPVPLGVPGELCAGGPGLARGYFGRPDLTAAVFVPDPLGEPPGGRTYRTGDLARFLPDGRIEYLGRIDQQVKIRGIRVEPGEVETVLAGHPEVRECAVVVGQDAAGKRLVAHAVPRDPAAPPSAADLRAWLGARLPEAMVPSAFSFLEALPLNASGKVDRRALAALAPTPVGGGSGAPRTECEALLAGLWAAVLGVERVGVRDDFFALGGHSLLATQLVSRVREVFGVELPLRALFEGPTVEALARRIETAERGEGAPPIVPVPRDGGPLPLSFAQERLWFLDQLEPGTTTLNMPASLRIREGLDVPALARTLDEVVRRHESLRTTFGSEEGTPFQRIAPPSPVPLPVIDLGGLSPEAARGEVERLEVGEYQLPFDLARGPLLRARLVRLGGDDWTLLLTLHHIVSDGWSMGLLRRELGALYPSFLEGRPSPLPPLPLQYADYAVWQRRWLAGDILERQIAYWREKLAGVPPLDLPTDRPRPAVQSYRGASLLRTLGPDLTSRLAALARREGATLFMVLLAGYQVLLSRLAGQEGFAVGVPVAGRTRSETEGLIGCFLNTLALRADLAGNPTIRELLACARATALEAYAHQDVPFEKLLEELNPERDLSRTPVFQVFLNMLNFPGDDGGIGGDEEGFTPDVPAKFELTVYAAETAGGITLNLVYNADLFDRERVEGMADQLEALLARMAEDPEARIASLSLLTPAAQAVLPDPEEELPFLWLGSIHERVARQAYQTPEALAAVDRSRAWTYRELDTSANRLAQWLIQEGVRPGDVVAVHAHRGASLAATLLGVWKAGAAFVILDPAYPAARIVSVLSLAGPAAEIEDRLELPGTLPADSPRLPVDPNATAYLVFTSGSTGRPKGIVGTHAPLSHFLDWHVRTFGLTSADRFSLLSGLSHDPLLRDLFTPLWLGATLCVPDPEEMGSPGWLAGWMARERVTVTHLTPAMGQLLAQDAPSGSLPDLRLAFFAGDVLTGRDVARLRRVAPSVRCVNFYGATETPQAMGWFEAGEGDRRIPVGRGIDGVQLLVLDPSVRLAGPGELGEIHIRTPYLAKGYLGDEEETQKRFVPDRGEVRLYRTGDLGRYRLDGSVDFAGRADTQVKIRGFRVEPEEIEAAVVRFPGVQECAVVLREDRLVAYVVPGPGTEVDASALRSHLAARLPGYMVPAGIVPLPALPLTPNGKLDRRALPAPERMGEEASAPRTPAEERMAEIWRELLGVEQVGVHDSFFDLGGHSLLATRLLSRLRTVFGAELPLRATFEHPTIEGMAGLLAAGEAAAPAVAPPLVPLPRTGDLPLSFAQERLWFLYQFDPASPAYNMAQAIRLEGDLDEAALTAALREVVRRQESLRTRFLTRDRRAVQVIDPVPDVVAPVVDLATLPADLREGEAAQIAREQALRPFDLERGPVLRVRLLRLTGRERLLAVAMHHIVTDGWSMGIFVREVAALYAALAGGRPSPLPELRLQYADFALWQRRAFAGEALEEALRYWRRQLAGAPVLELPTDRPRPAVQGPQGAREAVEIPADLARGLGDLARRQGATLFMVLTAAFQALLSRFSGQTDLTLGTPVAGRTRTELEDLIGFFVNTLVLRGDLAGNPSFHDLLGRTRETALAAFAHQQVPFERLVDELRPERSLSHTPLFQAMLVLQNAPAPVLESSDLTFRTVETATVTAKFDLTLTAVDPGPDGPLGMMLEYRTELFDAGTIRRMLAAFEILLAGAVADPGLHLSDLPLLRESERTEIAAWSGPRAAFPESACLHDLFGHQAASTPGAVAVTREGASLTYGELNARANRLARRLRRLGVGPESRVALAVERSLEMVVGILGILKAGGAYVPLDPSYPEERLAFLREDAQALVLLTREELTDPSLEAESGEDLGSLAHPDNAAYVIYTSGSTGVPKGTVVTHHNVARLFAATDPWFGFGPGDVWTLFHSFAFDFSVWEIWGALLYGGRLVVVPYLVSRTPGAFLDLLRSEGVTVLNQTPSAFRQLVQAEGERGSSLALRLVIFGGEALDLASLAPWFERHGDERPRLVNMYGITETTVHVSYRPITWADLGEPWRSPVGVPLPDLSIHILDSHGRPVPIGVPGEMHVGGAGLARGYLSRPDLTAERYVPDPFTGSGERLYRSGDLARWRPGREVDYLGRIDHQVKVRGFRIELGEIEAALVQHPAVREAVVLLRGEAGEPRLVAWIGTAGEEVPAGSDLRAFLAGKLPDYMIPAAFVALPALPLTAHGKVDRRALAAPEDLAEKAGRASVPPRTGLERLLVDLWEESLGLERIGIDDDFFELGGSSIRAAILINLLRERLGRPVPVSALFLAPTVARLAALLEESPLAAQSTAISPLVPLATGGPGLPFFCVHPAGGVVFCYADLARALAPDRPVYGLQSLGLGDRDPQETIEEMAATYLDEVLAVQPEGPYLLGGWSLGGAVALEMARQLRETGREVGLLVMIDTVAPWSVQRRDEAGQDDAGFVLERLAAELDPAAGEALRAEAGKLQGLSSEERLEGIVAAAKRTGLLPADLGTEPVRRLVRVYRSNEQAFAQYRPAPWAGRTLLVRASEGVMRREPALGWAGLLTGELETVTVEGTHQTILLEPGFEDLVRVLRERLAAIS